MAATLVQSALNQGATASLAVGSTQGWATPTSGNLLVAWANADATVTVNNSMAAGPSVVDGNGVYIWYKVSAGTETSFTFTPSVSDTITAGVLEYSGVTGTPFDVQSSSSIASGSGTSTTAVSVTATGTSGDLFVAVAGLHSLASTPTSPTWTNGFINQQSNNAGTPNTTTFVASFVADFQNTAAATVSTTCSWTGTMNDRQELLIAFKLAAGGAAAQIPTLVMARSA